MGIRKHYPIRVDGPGLINCLLYQQEARLVLHLVNLTSTSTFNFPLDELIEVGPLQISAKLPDGIKGNQLTFRVSNHKATAVVSGGWTRFTLKALLDHDLIVIS